MIGYHSTVNKGARWRENQGSLIPLSPPTKVGEVSHSEALSVLKLTGALFIRWESVFDQAASSNWWHVLKDFPETIDELPRKTRYLIRKAIKTYDVMPLEINDILTNGYSVYVKAYERYDTHEAILTEKEFCIAVRELPVQTEWWGVHDCETGKLVAFSENYIEDETCFYVTMWLEPEAMKKFAGYLLFHQMELHYLKDRGFRYISDGSRSLSHNTNIHDFLESKFNFRKAYAKLHVVYTPWLGVAVAVAFPFRKLIKKLPVTLFQKVYILLKQEEIRREFER